jgi:hypothetical protein
VKLPAASSGASVTEQSGTAPECDTRLRQGFGAVTSRFLPTASCGVSARRRVNPCPSGRIQAVLSPIFVTRETSCHSPGWMAGDGFRIRTAGVEMENRHLPDSENRIREVTFLMSSCDEKLPAAQRLFHEHGSNTGQGSFREGAAEDAS